MNIIGHDANVDTMKTQIVATEDRTQETQCVGTTLKVDYFKLNEDVVIKWKVR